MPESYTVASNNWDNGVGWTGPKTARSSASNNLTVRCVALPYFSSDHLVDKLVAPDGSGDRDHLHVGGHSWDEMRCAELSQLGFFTAARQHRNMIDVGVLDHRGERVLGAAG